MMVYMEWDGMEQNLCTCYRRDRIARAIWRVLYFLGSGIGYLWDWMGGRQGVIMVGNFGFYSCLDFGRELVYEGWRWGRIREGAARGRDEMR